MSEEQYKLSVKIMSPSLTVPQYVQGLSAYDLNIVLRTISVS